MTETIPVYIKGTDKVLQAEPAPGNQPIQAAKGSVAPYRGSYHIAAKTAILVELNQKHPRCSD